MTKRMSKKIPKLSTKHFAYAVFGMLLGDGCLTQPKKRGNTYLVIEHGPKQAGYAYYKSEFLKQHCDHVSVKQRTRKQFGGDYLVTRVCARMKPNVLRHITKFERFYNSDRKKIASTYVLRRITPIGLIFWFMDDGTASVKSRTTAKGYKVTDRTFRLGTYGFDDVSKARISAALKNRFGIDTKVIKSGDGNSLHNLGVHGMRQLIDVVRPHLRMVPRVMRYKFDMKYPEGSGLEHYSPWLQKSQAALSAQTPNGVRDILNLRESVGSESGAESSEPA